MIRRTLLSLAALVLVLLPAPAQALFSDISIVEEAEMGREFDKKVRMMLPIVEDPMIHDFVEGVIQRIYDKMPPQPFRVTTTVIANGTLNAFAVPGGYVYIFTGLLSQLDNEDQLAAVISHELAHVSQHHVVDRIEKMETVSIASTVGTLAGIFLGATGSGSTREMGKALTVGSQAAAYAAFLTYTQENEREADHVGLGYLVEAGYNPEGMPQTFEIMLRNQFRGTNTNLPSYLSTHPKLSERSAYLHARIAEMTADVVSRPFSTSRFERVRAIVRGRMSDPVWTVATIENQSVRDCYDVMALGMAHARLKHTAQARAAFEEALVCGQNDPLVLREAGIFFFKVGDFGQSLRYLQKSLFMNPGDIITLYYNARLLGEQGNYTEAIAYLNKVLRDLKTDAEVYYHLGRYEGASGDHFRGYLHLAYASLYGQDPDKVQFHLKQAQGLADTPEKQEELEKFNKVRKERKKD